MKIFKRRTLIYDNFNTMLFTIFYKIEDGEYDFNIWYQRDQIWGMNEKQKFLQSLFNDEEVGTFVYYEKNTSEIKDKKYLEIIDGNNRINCLKDFYENKLPYLHNDKEYYYKDLEENDRRELESKSISIKQFKGQHRILTDKE